MNRTITIKGVGRLSLKPDQVAVSLSLDTIDPVYEKAMRTATAELAQLRAAIAGVGFSEDDLKTASFNINTAYRVTVTATAITTDASPATASRMS